MEIASILYYPIGWLYLWIKYRNKKKIQEILQDKYDGKYYVAGAQLTVSIFGIILLMLLLLFLLIVIGRTIYDLIK